MKSQSVLVKFMDSGSESRQGSWGFLTFRTRNKEAQNQQMTVQVGGEHYLELMLAQTQIDLHNAEERLKGLL